MCEEAIIIKHLGDITKLNGAEIPVVDVITGGSPCQDLSVAGKRAGMKHEANGDDETTRSGLFMDQVRLVKEMREHDRSIGRTGVDVRPRWMVWENVPGAFSSNHGKDFQAVLEEIIKIAEPTAPSVPLPEEGRWSKSGCIYDELGKWSVAWRVHDAQFHGVPQRRKRISLLADFGGLAAPWIMFDPQLEREAPGGGPYETESDTGAQSRPEVQSVAQGVSGDSEQGREAGPCASGCVGCGASETGGAGCLNPWDIQSKHVQSAEGVAETLYSGEARYGGGEAYVLDKPDTICLEGNGSRESHFGNGYAESDVMYTLNTIEQHGVLPVAVDLYNHKITGDVAVTITEESCGVAGHSGSSVLAAGIVSKGNGEAWLMEEKTTSVTSGGGQAGQGYPAALVSEPIVLESNQNHATVTDNGVSPTLPASMGMGGGYVPMITDSWTIDEKIGQTYVHHESANTLAARDYKQPQAVLTEDHAISFQERAGKPGGGKGILLQGEHVGALSTLNNQSVLQHSGGGLTSLNSHGNGYSEEVSFTLNVVDTHGVAVDCRNATENADVNGTLQAKEQGQNLNSNNVCRTGNTVRRLTPLECERLQAFPDFWTRIGEWTDSKGKVHKEADTPRYKALGNSIALPFWYWLLNRISAQYDEDYTPTLGSLFDGISGFPYCWEKINGRGTAKWTSEIEEFPIAVCKKHFGDEDAGIEGDLDEYL